MKIERGETMSECIMGIEIGSSNIKIIETTKKAATMTIQRFSILNTPPESITNGVINNAEAIQKVIEEELNAKKYKAKKVVAVVQSNGILIRNAVMEKQPDKVIREILNLRTEEYLPVDKEQYQIDFKVVREYEDEEGTKNELLLVAAPNSVVLPVAEMIKALKRIPVLISIPSEALGNVFGERTRMVYEGAGNVMILDIGGNSSTATVIAEDQAVLTRSINFGVDSINRSIEEAYLGDKSQDEETYNEQIANVIRPQIEYNIIAELERILQFYYSNYKKGNIKKIYLIGGGANIKGMRTYIRDALNIPTEKLSEFNTVLESPGIEFEPYRRFFVNILGAINGL